MTPKELSDLVGKVKDVMEPFHYQLIKRIEELEKKVAELETRPQPTYALGGAGNYWPWGTMSGLSQTTGAIGTNVSHETPKGMNGPAETSVKAS